MLVSGSLQREIFFAR